MPEYVLLYNRLTQQNIGPEIPPATVVGDDPKTALKGLFRYSFRRVYGEAAKSPDVVVVEGTVVNGVITKKDRACRMSYIATKKCPDKEVSHENYRKKKQDKKTGRFIKS